MVRADEAASAAPTGVKRHMETLDRGVVAVEADGGNFVSWRLLGTDPVDIAFNLYRGKEKLNKKPLAGGTNFLDAKGKGNSKYTVRPVVNGKELPAAGESATVWGSTYLDIPITAPAGGTTPDGVAYTYNANDASAGDLDGDGEYELILKWDPSNSKDNSQKGYTGNVYVDAYKLDGTRLWRIDLGRNIRAGAHYTQFMVYDLDGDGRAEVSFKTADGTVDGTGTVIGDPNADYRNSGGYVLEGPEFLTVFEGNTGRALQTVPYDPPRGTVTDWGDGYGNRVDRFLAGVAYLDGERPSLIFARGYYTRAVVAAYDWRDGKLAKRWTFDTNESGNEGYRGQGNHNLGVADVDGDGRDEIIYGAAAIDDNGKGLYTTGLGHGDAMHLGDLDPEHPGMEVFQVHESKPNRAGIEYRDADSGELIWGVPTTIDVGRGVSADIDPRYKGEEVWAIDGAWNSPTGGLYSAKGELISTSIPGANFAIWWDGDLQREVLDHTWTEPNGVGKIDKWDYTNAKPVNLLTADGTLSNNWTKGNPNLQADLLGDWREEVIWRKADNTALRLYTTAAPTDTRIPTLMHDPVYRLGIAWQNTAYNQPPHPSFYLGEGMKAPGRPAIYTKASAKVSVTPSVLSRRSGGGSAPLLAAVTAQPGQGTPFGEARSASVTVNGQTFAAERVHGEGKAGVYGVKIDRRKVIGALDGLKGEAVIEVTLELEGGVRLTGTDRIRITD
ncbi:rhamnogalacturonan lyase [Paenibacillus mucilaginosus]|nr:rhamnogalacturonan lyase [Paenibacillus caseinilyticus]